LGEAGADSLAGMGIGGVAQELTIGGAILDVDQCVAAVEDGERRERVEAGTGAVEARGAVGNGGAGEAAEGLSGGLQPSAGKGEADGWVLALDARGEDREPVGTRAQEAVGGGLQAVSEVVQALSAAADEGL